MSIFKTRKNKRYEPVTRFYEQTDGERPFEVKGRFDEFRTTTGGGLKGKFNRAMADYKQGSDRETRTRLRWVLLILLLLFFWIIDFDLSIFTGN